MTKPLPTEGAPGLGERLRSAGRTVGRAGAAIWHGARLTGGASARAARATGRGFRRLTHARGAGESGLGRVIELHLVSTLADALIVTALASTIFFAVPTQQARGRVATSLLITMVPFVLLAPVLGPLLDRVRRGRRYALATTMVIRAFLAWVMAGAVGGTGSSQAAFSLYPAAFGFLVCQKAYLVTRAAAVPRVLPRDTGLVVANSRISMAGVAAITIGGPLGAGITAAFGPSWTLRLAFVVFAAGTALALALPGRVDSSAGEVTARISRSTGPRTGARTVPLTSPVPAGSASRAPAGSSASESAARAAARTASLLEAEGFGRGRGRSWNTGPRIVLGLRGNSALRAFAGFLTLFLAFRLRQHPLGGLRDTTAVALVVVLASVGGGVGTALGGRLRRIRPEALVVGMLALATLASAWSALDYGLWPVLAVCLAAGVGQSLGKLSLDALIQDEVPEHVRTSAFARTETVLQLAWVIGGGIGLALPLSGRWGLSIATAAILAMTVVSIVSLVTLQQDRRHPRLPAEDPDPG